MDAEKTKPERVIRFGPISASIFLNEIDAEGGRKTVRNVKLQRRYKQGDQWKTSSSFTLVDLPTAIAVLQNALDHVARLEAVSSGE